MANISKAERDRRAAEAAANDQAAKPDVAINAEQSAPTATKRPKLVPMIREDGMTGDVHPDEVANYKAGGWREA